MSQKEDIRSLSFDKLVKYLDINGEKSFRATQIFEGIYQKGILGFEQMRNLPQELRDRLSQDFVLNPLSVCSKEVSQDGTVKFLFDLEDQERTETVLIPTKSRMTACVSTQVGCKFGCHFCASGIGGWKRNLSAAEILSQILQAKDLAIQNNSSLTHVVFMGIGEPLDNYLNVMKAIRIINDERAMNIGARRITISTCGVIPQIRQLAKEGLQIELSISLHGYDNASRDFLMPVNQRYPFDELIQACRDYADATNRQITFEYVLIKDQTCSKKAAQSLKKSLKGLLCKMNLIPYNPVKEFDFQTPSLEQMLLFKSSLEDMGIHATLRMPRGKDINSACGQLRHVKNRKI